ncbi:MAG: hypothetical protein Q7S57_01810 [bacterium]|nr:hypothetical protein [bacterium]
MSYLNDSGCFKWADRLCRTRFRNETDIGYAVMRLLSKGERGEQSLVLGHIMAEYRKYPRKLKPKKYDKMSREVWESHMQNSLPLYRDLVGLLMCGSIPKDIVADYLLFRLKDLEIEKRTVLLGNLLVWITPYEYVPEEVYLFGESGKAKKDPCLSDHLPTVLRQVEKVSFREGLSPKEFWRVVLRLIGGLSEENAALALMHINTDVLDDDDDRRGEYPLRDEDDVSESYALEVEGNAQDPLLMFYGAREWRAIRSWFNDHRRFHYQ